MCHITDEVGNDVPELCRVPHGQKVPSLRWGPRARARVDGAEGSVTRASDDDAEDDGRKMRDGRVTAASGAEGAAREMYGVAEDARGTSRDGVGERDARAGRANVRKGYASAPKISRLMRENPDFSALEALLALARD